jgi:mycothiol synthase
MIVKLSENNFKEFKNYALKHKKEHDESYLYDEDFDQFSIDENNPTNLLFSGEDEVGVISLIQDDYQLRGKSTRVRIFHCESGKLEDYKNLLESVMPINNIVERLTMFVPTNNLEIRSILESLGMFVERYSYVLERVGKEPLDFSLPNDYELTDYRYGIDEEDYLKVRNIAFSTLKGSQTPQTVEHALKMNNSENVLTGGIKILRYNGEPVGVIRMEHEIEEGRDYSFVAPIAILPNHQGKGLGSCLIRAGIKVGCDNGYWDCMLSVNGENENAIKLYLKEGFEKTFEVVCYNLIIDKG